MVAIGDPNQEGVIDENWVNLHINVKFYVPAILFVGVGDKVDAGNVSEGSLVIRIDLVHFESVFKNFTVHQLIIIQPICKFRLILVQPIFRNSL